MNDQDKRHIENWMTNEPASITLRLARGEHQGADLLAGFCDDFKALVPAVRILNASDDPFKSPAIIIGSHENIAYQAVPTDKELAPFLEALAAADGDKTKTSSPPQIGLPADLSLFVARQCPHCPAVVRQLLNLAGSNPQLRLTIIDGQLFEELTAANDIRSVPTLILDNQLRWTGQINLQEVVDQCVKRDPSQLSAASLRQIIESGEAERLSTMMADSNRIYPAFLELLLHERWSVRLGAMVTVEYLADENPDLAVKLVDQIWNRFEGLPEPVQGDTVQVMGQIPGDLAQSCLEHIVAGDFPESVKEAAAEELETRKPS